MIHNIINKTIATICYYIGYIDGFVKGFIKGVIDTIHNN